MNFKKLSQIPVFLFLVVVLSNVVNAATYGPINTKWEWILVNTVIVAFVLFALQVFLQFQLVYLFQL